MLKSICFFIICLSFPLLVFNQNNVKMLMRINAQTTKADYMFTMVGTELGTPILTSILKEIITILD